MLAGPWKHRDFWLGLFNSAVACGVDLCEEQEESYGPGYFWTTLTGLYMCTSVSRALRNFFEKTITYEEERRYLRSLRSWAKILDGCAIDLETYGLREQRNFRKGKQRAKDAIHSGVQYQDHNLQRWLCATQSITFGLRPSDWSIEYTNASSPAGLSAFWIMAERPMQIEDLLNWILKIKLRTEERLEVAASGLPGAWVDTEERKSVYDFWSDLIYMDGSEYAYHVEVNQNLEAEEVYDKLNLGSLEDVDSDDHLWDVLPDGELISAICNRALAEHKVRRELESWRNGFSWQSRRAV
jgi:hypothetical protein